MKPLKFILRIKNKSNVPQNFITFKHQDLREHCSFPTTLYFGKLRIFIGSFVKIYFQNFALKLIKSLTMTSAMGNFFNFEFRLFTF